MPTHLHFRTFGFLAALVAASSVLSPLTARAADPNSPEVRSMVKNALTYLATANDGRLGGNCLIGLCFKKADHPEHPKVAYALDLCAKANLLDQVNVENYSLGIALAFLCEVDPEGQRSLIQKYLAEVFSRQKTFGAWGYKEYVTGDTSQTQYAVLGMWMAKNHAKVDVPIERIEGAARWLMLTQDPSGGWGYQGHLDRKQQEQISPTLTAAGDGSLYMLADMLQVFPNNVPQQPNKPKSKALQEVAGKKDPSGPLTSTLNPADIKTTLANGDRWMGAHFVMPAETWNHYYMYALERYHSFRESATGVKDERWYQSGVEYLAKTQSADGSWEGSPDHRAIATSFAVLFLLRSAKKAIVIQKKLQMGDGIARAGGIRLPKDIKSIEVTKDGKLVDPGVVIPTEQILQLINSGENEEVTRLAEEKEALILSSNKSERDSQIEKLRKFVGAGDYNARMVAVTTLGKVRDLNNVPRLLYAMTDPEPAIVRQADQGLRFISRKVEGVGLPDGDLTRDQIKAARAAWKAWYLSIRPNAELLD